MIIYLRWAFCNVYLITLENVLILPKELSYYRLIIHSLELLKFYYQLIIVTQLQSASSDFISN